MHVNKSVMRMYFEGWIPKYKWIVCHFIGKTRRKRRDVGLKVT